MRDRTLSPQARDLRTKYLLCTLSLLLLQSCNSNGAETHTADSDCKRRQLTPVLFVHGSGLDASSWDSMQTQLLAQGYAQSYLHAVNLRPSTGDNVVAAETAIRDGVDQLLRTVAMLPDAQCAKSAPTRIAIVAHSMGAISSRWYASRVAPENIAALITIAGANHGTNALCNRTGSGDQQMCPAFAASSDASAVQVQLNGTARAPLDETPFGIGRDAEDIERIPPDAERRILYVAVFLADDEWIVPTHSARLSGAGGMAESAADGLPLERVSAGNYRFTEPSAHDELPAHPALATFVYRSLNGTVANP